MGNHIAICGKMGEALLSFSHRARWGTAKFRARVWSSRARERESTRRSRQSSCNTPFADRSRPAPEPHPSPRPPPPPPPRGCARRTAATARPHSSFPRPPTPCLTAVPQLLLPFRHRFKKLHQSWSVGSIEQGWQARALGQPGAPSRTDWGGCAERGLPQLSGAHAERWPHPGIGEGLMILILSSGCCLT